MAKFIISLFILLVLNCTSSVFGGKKFTLELITEPENINSENNLNITVCSLDENKQIKQKYRVKFQPIPSSTKLFVYGDKTQTAWYWIEHIKSVDLSIVSRCRLISTNYNEIISNHLKNSPYYETVCSRNENQCCKFNQSDCCIQNTVALRQKRSGRGSNSISLGNNCGAGVKIQNFLSLDNSAIYDTDTIDNIYDDFIQNTKLSECVKERISATSPKTYYLNYLIEIVDQSSQPKSYKYYIGKGTRTRPYDHFFVAYSLIRIKRENKNIEIKHEAQSDKSETLVNALESDGKIEIYLYKFNKGISSCRALLYEAVLIRLFNDDFEYELRTQLLNDQNEISDLETTIGRDEIKALKNFCIKNLLKTQSSKETIDYNSINQMFRNYYQDEFLPFLKDEHKKLFENGGEISDNQIKDANYRCSYGIDYNEKDRFIMYKIYEQVKKIDTSKSFGDKFARGILVHLANVFNHFKSDDTRELNNKDVSVYFHRLKRKSDEQISRVTSKLPEGVDPSFVKKLESEVKDAFIELDKDQYVYGYFILHIYCKMFLNVEDLGRHNTPYQVSIAERVEQLYNYYSLTETEKEKIKNDIEWLRLLSGILYPNIQHYFTDPSRKYANSKICRKGEGETKEESTELVEDNIRLYEAKIDAIFENENESNELRFKISNFVLGHRVLGLSGNFSTSYIPLNEECDELRNQPKINDKYKFGTNNIMIYLLCSYNLLDKVPRAIYGKGDQRVNSDKLYKEIIEKFDIPENKNANWIQNYVGRILSGILKAEPTRSKITDEETGELKDVRVYALERKTCQQL